MQSRRSLFARGNRLCLSLISLTILLTIASRGQVPLDQPKSVTRARVSTPVSALQFAAKEVDRGSPAAHSSFATLNDGHKGLGARLRLIEAAEQTLDLQYFLMKPDLGAALVSRALLDAADRGVRVRFLLDGVFTTVSDKDLGLLSAHPNIDVRIFNPAARPGPKAAGFFVDFSRTNRRMHNKSFIADGAFAVIGGRNIADEYYKIDTTSEFFDFDILVVGPAVVSISSAFDLYWYDGWSVPMEQLRKAPTETQFSQARVDLAADLIQGQATYGPSTILVSTA